MEKKLKYPELEQDNYVAQVEAETAEAKKRAEQLEKQAKWDRDMALWGDMANLAAKGAAMHGGAWKINKDESAATKGNERLRALQKENAAQTAAFAKERAALREAKRKEQNAQKLAQYNAELEAYKSAQTQANADRDFAEKKRHNEETEKNYRARVQRLAAQGGSGGAANFLKVTMPDGTVKNYSKKELGDNWINYAYEELVKAGMPRAMKYKLNPLTGMPEPYEDTSLAGRKAYMETWSAGNAQKGNGWDGWKDGNATEDIDEDFE